MSMYRIINKETGLIYSEELGWVKENRKMYGHCFEWDEAELIGRKFSNDGIPVIIKRDKVASRFERVVNFSFPKLYLMTAIGLIAFVITTYFSKDIVLNVSEGQDAIIAVRNAFSPVLVPLIIIGITVGIFLLTIVVKYSK